MQLCMQHRIEMHRRYIYRMYFGAIYGRMVRSCLIALVALCVMAAHASTSVQAQAQARIEQALDSALSAQQRASLTRQIRVASPRGAALQPCPSGWQWAPVSLEYWQRVHINVHCEGRAGSLVAVIDARAPVWATASDLPKGHRLQAQDLQRQEAPVHSLQDMPDAATLVHMQLRKPLRAGTALRLQHLERAVYARKGEKVEIRASVQGITVSMDGIAARTAYQGETLRVRNLRSQQWVTGRLVAPGILEASDQASGGVKVQMQSND